MTTKDNTVNDELLDFESDDAETNGQVKSLNWAEYGTLLNLSVS